MKRRDFLGGVAASLAAAPLTAAGIQSETPPRGRLKQGVMSSVFQGLDIPFEERCRVLQRLGFQGYDLPSAQQVPVLREFGLEPTMMTGTGTSFANGLIRRELHDQFEEAFYTGIDTCAEVGCPNLIALPGERRGMSREEGADNAVAMLDRVKGYAEEKGVTLCMEVTNSRVEADNRTDQVFDHVDWGFDVCRRTNSPNVKVVFDIYHVQIADGDVTRRLRDNFDLICHIHVAGVPTRNEIDDTQELNYRFIAAAIADLGYTGFVSHEHRPGPGRDPLESLALGFEILTV